MALAEEDINAISTNILALLSGMYYLFAFVGNLDLPTLAVNWVHFCFFPFLGKIDISSKIR